jgi:glycosyltransferase involved in cell wall biosynthesis
MKISVILCTYNRCQSLQLALESLASSQMPESTEWEVLVIDNNSKDDTRKVVEAFSASNGRRFKYIFEPQQGKSFALNRGIREASGEILAFVDDDITAEPTWLMELTKPLSNPEWVGTGGRVYLPKNFVAPSWMAVEGHHSLVSILALFDLGAEAHLLKISPLGNNMAFRRQIFEQYGGFRTDLGPMPGSEIRYEDTEFATRVMSGGGRILYVPTAIVRHAIDPRRLSKKYFLAYHFDYGRALIREKGKRAAVGVVPRSFISLLNRVLHILPKRAWAWIRETEMQKRFFNKCRVWTTIGEISEICKRPLRAPESKKTDVAFSD